MGFDQRSICLQVGLDRGGAAPLSPRPHPYALPATVERCTRGQPIRRPASTRPRESAPEAGEAASSRQFTFRFRRTAAPDSGASMTLCSAGLATCSWHALAGHDSVSRDVLHAMHPVFVSCTVDLESGHSALHY